MTMKKKSKRQQKRKSAGRSLRTSSNCISRAVPDVDTKISPNLTWVFPFLKKAKQKMPSLVLPRYIRSHRPSTTRVMRVLGNAYYDSRIIVVATHTQLTTLDKSGRLRINRLVRLPKSKILDTLAHEIAHLVYNDHGYEHEAFTKVIFRTFGIKEKCPHCKGAGKIDLESKP